MITPPSAHKHRHHVHDLPFQLIFAMHDKMHQPPDVYNLLRNKGVFHERLSGEFVQDSWCRIVAATRPVRADIWTVAVYPHPVHLQRLITILCHPPGPNTGEWCTEDANTRDWCTKVPWAHQCRVSGPSLQHPELVYQGPQHPTGSVVTRARTPGTGVPRVRAPVTGVPSWSEHPELVYQAGMNTRNWCTELE